MKTLDFALAIIALRDMQVKTLQERVEALEVLVRSLRKENNELQTELSDLLHDLKVESNRAVGFKQNTK